LTTLAGLANVSTIEGGMTIEENNLLPDLDLPALTFVGGGIYVESNASLSSLSGVSGLPSVGGDLSINDNDALSVIDLPALMSVDGDLNISGNDCLSQTETEDFAAGLTISGDVTVEDNGANYPCE